MSLLLRLRLAKQRGEAILSEEKLTKLAVDPFEIAARHDIIVQAKPDTASGVSGMLLRHGNSFGIPTLPTSPMRDFSGSAWPTNWATTSSTATSTTYCRTTVYMHRMPAFRRATLMSRRRTISLSAF